ncbi:MAG TPA: hypothetical protein DEO88_08355, partial [Syntrophobacteraceae bacterium]|nr:hypothetical protein [Syntrophobacteraceae bacterium]
PQKICTLRWQEANAAGERDHPASLGLVIHYLCSFPAESSVLASFTMARSSISIKGNSAGHPPWF